MAYGNRRKSLNKDATAPGQDEKSRDKKRRKSVKQRVDAQKKNKREPITIDKAHSLKLRGVEKVIKIKRIRPNPWNPNRMSPHTRDKLAANMRAFGFIDPILVRSGNENGPFPDGGYEIIDGEQRWTVAQEVGLKKVKITDIGNLSDSSAKVLTINFNDMRGKHDRDALANIVGELALHPGGNELIELLPYDAAEIDGLRSLNAAEFEKLEDFPPEEHDRGGSAEEEDDTIASILELDRLKPRRMAKIAASLEGLRDYLTDHPPEGIDMSRPGSLLDALLAGSEAHYDVEAVSDEPEDVRKGRERDNAALKSDDDPPKKKKKKEGLTHHASSE